MKTIDALPIFFPLTASHATTAWRITRLSAGTANAAQLLPYLDLPWTIFAAIV